MTALTFFTVVADYKSIVSNGTAQVTAVVTFRPVQGPGNVILADGADPRPTGLADRDIIGYIGHDGRLQFRPYPWTSPARPAWDLSGPADAVTYPYTPVRLLADTLVLELDTPLYYRVIFSEVFINGKPGEITGFTFRAPNTDTVFNLIQAQEHLGESWLMSAPRIIGGQFVDDTVVFKNQDGSYVDPITLSDWDLVFIDNHDSTWSVDEVGGGS